MKYDEARGRYRAILEMPRDPATGKRRRKWRYAESRDVARAKLAELRQERDQLAARRVGDVADLLDLWHDRGAPSSKGMKSPSSMKRARWAVDHLTAGLGHRSVTELTTEDVEDFLRAKARTGMARDTLVQLRSHLSQAYDFGLARRHVAWNPAKIAVISAEAVDQKRQPRALTHDELVAILDAAESHRLGAWVVVAGTLGLRPGEVSGLEWQDVDLDNGVAVIHQSLAWHGRTPMLKPTKTKTTRTLRLPERTISAFGAHRERQRAEQRAWAAGEWSDLVFRTQRGTPLDPANVRRIVSDIAAAANVDGSVRPYDFRHTVTTQGAALGISPEALADVLGHADTRMVWQHYRHRGGRVIEVLPSSFGS